MSRALPDTQLVPNATRVVPGEGLVPKSARAVPGEARVPNVFLPEVRSIGMALAK